MLIRPGGITFQNGQWVGPQSHRAARQPGPRGRQATRDEAAGAVKAEPLARFLCIEPLISK